MNTDNIAHKNNITLAFSKKSIISSRSTWPAGKDASPMAATGRAYGGAQRGLAGGA